MNKKIMSFVLAAVFVLSIGTNSWAYRQTGSAGGGTISVGMSDIYDQYGTGVQTTPDGAESDEAKKETNRICAVFNYASGIVLTAMDQDRNLTIYSAGMAFISLTYNPPSGDANDLTSTITFGYFTLASVTISGSDYLNVQEQGGLEEFLRKLGASESMLSHAKQEFGTDEEGNQTVKVNKNETEKLGWLSEAMNHTSMGVNHSITINFTASGGASVTLITNGKQMATLGYDYGQYGEASFTPLATYNYNAAGTLESITQKTYKSDSDHVATGNKETEKDEDGKDKGQSVDSVTYFVAFTEIHMDSYGRQDFVTDTNGNIVTTYSYSTTGSIAAIHDLTTNNTTWYAAGHASFVLNDSGFKTTEYYYHENGSLDWVCTFNFDEDKNAVFKTQGTAYLFGKFWGSANLADLEVGQASNGDEIRNNVNYIKAHPEEWVDSLEKGAKGALDNDEDIQMTLEIGGQKVTFTWNGSGWIDEDGNQVTDDIDAAIAAAKKEWLAASENNKEEDWNSQSAASSTSYRGISQYAYKQLTEKGKELAKAAVRNTSRFANLTSIPIYASDLKNTAFIDAYKQMFCMKTDDNGNRVWDQGALNAFDKAIEDALRLSNGSSALLQVSLTIDAKAFDTVPDEDNSTKTTNVKTVVTGSRSMGSHTWHSTRNIETGKEVTNTTSEVTQVGRVGQQISSKVTIMDHGLQCYQIALNAYTLRDSRDQMIATHSTTDVTMTGELETDPAVKGEMWTPSSDEELYEMAAKLNIDINDKQAMEDLRNGFYTVDGQTYAIVKAAEVNLMDGTGFHTAAGETIIVAIDSDTKKAIETSGTKSVMFMGTVRESQGGFMTMTMKSDWAGGVAIGEEAIKQTTAAINAATEIYNAEKVGNTELAAQLRQKYDEDGSLPKDKEKDFGWVAENTAINSDKLKDFKWVGADEKDPKNIQKNLQDAWQLLF